MDTTKLENMSREQRKEMLNVIEMILDEIAEKDPNLKVVNEIYKAHKRIHYKLMDLLEKTVDTAKMLKETDGAHAEKHREILDYLQAVEGGLDTFIAAQEKRWGKG